MDGGSGPRSPEIGQFSLGIQSLRYLSLGAFLIDEHLIDAANDFLFIFRAGNQDDTIGLQTFLLPAG